ncbi:MAG: NPCBM/NEW2 domain-containing protein [Ardenticatenaceae bacterium]|nr:NPCBM/NEW2 domain-containing protein [Ardenticatenaceae bacterium]
MSDHQVAREAHSVHVDALTPTHVQVGYGRLGTHGRLGYENKNVTVGGQEYRHALSAHPPARLRYALNGRYHTFTSHIALNDDVRPGVSHAEFTVKADGRVAANVHVAAGEAPRPIHADISGAQTLELIVTTSRWEFCHAVWLNPQLDAPERATAVAAQPLTDCLGRAEITLPPHPIHARRILATIVSPGFEHWLDDLLGSFYAYGNCPDARIVVFTAGDSAACRQVIAKYGAAAISCHPQTHLNPTLKSVLYTVAHIATAEQYLCLDADMLVVGDLSPIFAALDACPPQTILACREGNGRGFTDLGHILTTAYGGRSQDLQRILGHANGEHAYPLVVNDGLFAGSRAALLALDDAIRAMPEATAWVDEYRHIRWRNQFIFNLALARLNCGVELDPAYNLQLHVQDAELSWRGGKMTAQWHGRTVRVLHFSGSGRGKYPQWRGQFAGKDNPLAQPGHDDHYTNFVAALRGWAGRFGAKGLAWSFYGTTDGQSARVNDPAALPLLALLHYLVRANGCVRVLESGTARGISAACLAAAVAHRPAGRVVTMDLAPAPEREALWAALPPVVQGCIEQRVGDSLTLMAAAVAHGEQYEAALLDSLHTADHVWAEFQLAAQLVCPGGLILIHDSNYAHGSVGRALEKIEAAGYAVARLWSAQSGVREDDNLGLAMVVNKQPLPPPHRRPEQTAP